LYFRLQTIPIPVPPLRERTEEILPLAQWKLESVCERYSLPQKHFSQKAQEALLSYAWHGNVRELLSVVERAGILSDGEEINEQDLFLENRSRAFGAPIPTKQSNDKIAALEKELISQTLIENNNNVQKASDMLGMSLEVLRHKIARYGL